MAPKGSVEMRHVRPSLTLFFVWLFPVMLVASALAQQTTGDITGSVVVSTGAVLPGVTVTATGPATNFARTVTTDAQGGFSIPELPICVYKVSAELPGFKTISRDTQVSVNTVTKADFKLEVGTQSETITVEAVSPLVEFSDKLNNNVDTERIVDIPLSGRDFNSLLAITPGVQRDPGGGFLAVSISGMRHTSNNYMIDGISNNDRYYGDSVMNQVGILGVPATLVPMDAIAEFTIQQTPSAEFGVKGGSAINVVMKSGTNQVHGTGYYFRHDDWTDAPNFFVERSGGDTTKVRNQQYGGTFGGPIVKDKTFYFGYFEGQRLSQISPYDVLVPTGAEIADARNRIAAAHMSTNPIGEALLKFYPLNDSGKLTVQAPNLADMSTFSVKIDHRFNQNNLVNGRLFYGHTTQSGPAGNTGELTPANGPADMFNTVTDPPMNTALVGLVWNSTLSSRTLLETRLGYTTIGQTLAIPGNRIDPKSLGLDTGPLDEADLGIPAVYLGSFGYIGGVGGYPISTNPTSSWSVSTALTQTRGQHTVKLGGSWDLAKNHSLRNRARTSLRISGGTFDDVDSLVGLLLGRFDSAARSFGSTSRNLRQPSFGVFINDEWKISPRVTVSGGLRYDIHWPVSETDDIASKFVPSLGKLVRVGQGIDQLYQTNKDLFGPRAGLAWDLTGDGKTSFRTGYALTYGTSRGRDLTWFRDINGPPLGTPVNAIQQSRPFYNVAPDLAHIIQMTNDGKSWYDALQLSYRQNSWHGINSQYNYTLSKCEDYNSDNTRGRNNFPQANNPYDPAANKGPCDFDRRHNFNVAGTYSFPESSSLGPISRGWTVGTVVTVVSGVPFTPNVSSRDRSGQDTGSLRADCFVAPIYDFTSPDGFITNAAQAFGTPADGRLGTCGRNSVRRPGLAQWDLNILKSFRLSGSSRIEARWEVFNLLNRVNLGFPISTNVRSGAFGTIAST